MASWGGSDWDVEILSGDQAANFQSMTSSDSSALVTWTEPYDDDSNSETPDKFRLYGARWNGDSWTTNLIAGANGELQRVQAGYDGARSLVAWSDSPVQGGEPQTYASVWDGARWNAPEPIPGADAVTVQDGVGLVAWLDKTVSPAVVKARTWTDAGWSAPSILSTNDNAELTELRLARDGILPSRLGQRRGPLLTLTWLPCMCPSGRGQVGALRRQFRPSTSKAIGT